MPRRRREVSAAAADRHPPVSRALWNGAAIALLSTGLAFGLYWFTAASGLTWAHDGADGGDLLAAALTGGVPHPSGYPLYTALLQGWLRIGQALAPSAEAARLGNLFSALAAALSAGVTALVARYLIGPVPGRQAIALATALLWTVSPLQWSQALITEVYALHMLLAALLAWTVLTQPRRLLLVAVVMALGLANHLTFALLLPAAGYWLWRGSAHPRTAQPVALALVSGLSLLVLLYARIPVAAAGEGSPPPINWGYADGWGGFWWLVSGAAYRGYLTDLSGAGVAARIGGWAQTLTGQYTVVGLALAGLGLMLWDRRRPALRTFGLLWALPVSAYAVAYSTWDSRIYLLPATWMLALWLGSGLSVLAAWLWDRRDGRALWAGYAPAVIALVAVATLVATRLPEMSLRQDDEARAYLADVVATLEPESIVVSGADAETFALWYGAWGSGVLLEKAPGAMLVNYALYQFPWYGRLLGDLYPATPGVSAGLDALLAENDGRRPVYFTELLDVVPRETLSPAGPLWRYTP